MSTSLTAGLCRQVVPEAVLERLLTACRSGRYEKLELAVTELILDGYAAAQVRPCCSSSHDKANCSVRYCYERSAKHRAKWLLK